MPSNFPFIVDDGLGRGRSFFKLCSSAQEKREERQAFLSFFHTKHERRKKRRIGCCCEDHLSMRPKGAHL